MSIPFPDIDPVALTLGPLQIRWYALAYLAGFLGGWRYALHLAGQYSAQIKGWRPNRDDIDDFLSYAVIGVIVGGRLGYVLFYNAEYYWANPLEALKIWEGGMAFHGGALGVILAMIVYSLVRKVPLLRLSDIVCMVVPIGLFFGRMANFINSELYGRVTNVSWGMVFPHGGGEPRHPSQLYEAFFEGLVLFVILLILNKIKSVRERYGVISGAFLCGYALFRFGIEYYREPDFHLGFIIQDLSMGQILCVPMFILGAGVILYSLSCQSKATKA